MSLQDRMREAVLDQFIAVKDGEAAVDGSQLLEGQWYVPKFGIDTLDHVLDALLAQSEELGAVRAVLESVYRIVVNGHCSQDVVTVIGKMRDASDSPARAALAGKES